MNTKQLFLAFVLLFSLNFSNAQFNLVRNFNNPPTYFYVHNNKLYFNAREVGTSNSELWVYDGTTPTSSTNPKLVKDLDDNPSVGTSPKSFVSYNGKLFFSNNNNLFSYDDNQPISATNPKIIGNRGNGLKVFDNKLFYEEATQSPISIWTYDDNLPIDANNPKRLVSTAVNTIMTNYQFNPYVFNGKLYFSGKTLTADQNFELQVYDPNQTISASNPSRVYDINPGTSGSSPGGFVNFQNKLFFTANDGTGEELWVYNGTANPTKVYDIDPTPYGGLAYWKTIYDNKLFFSAHNNLGTELWKYDGVTNPQLVVDIFVGSEYSIPRNLLVYDNKLFFNATNGTNGRELYYYDSLLPVSSTNPKLMDMFIGSESGIDVEHDIIVYNGKLYFSGKTSNSNIGLFSLDASNLSTIEATDTNSSIKIYPIPSSGTINIESSDNIKNIQVVNNLGQNVLSSKTNSKKEMVTVKNKGIYFVIINTDKQREVRKIIVK